MTFNGSAAAGQERMSAKPSPAPIGFRSRGLSGAVRPETLRRRGEREAGNKSFIFSMKDGLLPLQTETSILGNKTLFMSTIDGRCDSGSDHSRTCSRAPGRGFQNQLAAALRNGEHAMRVALRPGRRAGLGPREVRDLT